MKAGDTYHESEDYLLLLLNTYFVHIYQTAQLLTLPASSINTTSIVNVCLHRLPYPIGPPRHPAQTTIEIGRGRILPHPSPGIIPEFIIDDDAQRSRDDDVDDKIDGWTRRHVRDYLTHILTYMPSRVQRIF